MSVLKLFLMFVLLLGTCSTLVTAAQHDELKLVISFSRHGARKPKDFKYIKKMYADEGSGLTKLGKQQHIDLGRSLHEKYVNNLSFLSKTYNNAEVLVKSDSGEKILGSAYCHLKGLYEKELRLPCLDPADSKDVPRVNLQINGREHDLLFNPTHACLKIEARMKESERSSIAKPYEESLKISLFPHLVKRYNKVAEADAQLTKLSKLKEVAELYDTYVTNKAHGKILPDFGEYERQMKQAVFFYFYKLKYADETVRKAATSELFTEWLEHIKDTIAGHSFKSGKPYKLVSYIGHETNLMNILANLFTFHELQAFPDALPPYSASLQIELWEKKSSGQHYVKLNFNGKEVLLNKCSHHSCSVEDFEKVLKDGILPDLKKICKMI